MLGFYHLLLSEVIFLVVLINRVGFFIIRTYGTRKIIFFLATTPVLPTLPLNITSVFMVFLCVGVCFFSNQLDLEVAPRVLLFSDCAPVVPKDQLSIFSIFFTPFPLRIFSSPMSSWGFLVPSSLQQFFPSWVFDEL